MLILKPLPCIFGDERCNLLYIHICCVNAKVVASLVTPVRRGNHVVARSSAFVNLLDFLFYLFVRKLAVVTGTLAASGDFCMSA